MESSDLFIKTVKNHLDKLAKSDALFAEKYASTEKNINDCCTFIMNEMKSSKRTCVADDEVYGLAVHYYEEKDVKVGSPVKCRVIVPKSGSESPLPIKRPAKRVEEPAAQLSFF